MASSNIDQSLIGIILFMEKNYEVEDGLLLAGNQEIYTFYNFKNLQIHVNSIVQFELKEIENPVSDSDFQNFRAHIIAVIPRDKLSKDLLAYFENNKSKKLRHDNHQGNVKSVNEIEVSILIEKGKKIEQYGQVEDISTGDIYEYKNHPKDKFDLNVHKEVCFKSIGNHNQKKAKILKPRKKGDTCN